MLEGLKQKVRRLIKKNNIDWVLGYIWCLYDTRLFTGTTLEEYMTLKSFAIKEDNKIKDL